MKNRHESLQCLDIGGETGKTDEEMIVDFGDSLKIGSDGL